jgi:phospholipase C
VVVIFDENISFDHYFGTYPKAANTDGTKFKAKGTPKVERPAHAGLLRRTRTLQARSGSRHSQALTCDQNHSYGPEQYAYDGGKADKFVENTEVTSAPGLIRRARPGDGLLRRQHRHRAVELRPALRAERQLVHSGYGPSTPGALNLISGQTHGVSPSSPPPRTRSRPTPYPATVASPDAKGVGTVINDPDPAFDDCSDKNHTSTSALGR